MSNYGAPNTVTGKAFVKQQVVTTATVLALPIVTEEEIKSAHGAVNIARLSGKRRGAMVLVERKSDSSLMIAIAQGSAIKDKWYLVAQGTAVIPTE